MRNWNHGWTVWCFYIVGVNTVKVLWAVLVDLHSVYGLIQRACSKFVFRVMTHKPYINSLTARSSLHEINKIDPKIFTQYLDLQFKVLFFVVVVACLFEFKSHKHLQMVLVTSAVLLAPWLVQTTSHRMKSHFILFSFYHLFFSPLLVFPFSSVVPVWKRPGKNGHSLFCIWNLTFKSALGVRAKYSSPKATLENVVRSESDYETVDNSRLHTEICNDGPPVSCLCFRFYLKHWTHESALWRCLC